MINFDAKSISGVLNDKKFVDLFGKIVTQEHPLHAQRKTDNFPWFADWLIDYTEEPPDNNKSFGDMKKALEGAAQIFTSKCIDFVYQPEKISCRQ